MLTAKQLNEIDRCQKMPVSIRRMARELWRAEELSRQGQIKFRQLEADVIFTRQALGEKPHEAQHVKKMERRLDKLRADCESYRAKTVELHRDIEAALQRSNTMRLIPV